MPLSSFKPADYDLLLEAKAKRLTQLLSDFDSPPLAVFRSPTEGFRMRAEFRFWHEGHDAWYAMFDPQNPKTPVRIDHFPIGSNAVNQLMKAVREAVFASHTLKERLFQVEFLTTLAGDHLVTLIYHRKLDDVWLDAAKQLEEKLNISIIGRSKKQKCVLSKDFVDETLNVDGKPLHYRQIEGGFTQPNAVISQKMLSWAIECCDEDQKRHDLLELYCGNGNFTVALAPSFRQVLATEISKTSVNAAHHNFRINGIDNSEVLRMSSEEFTQALNGEREFRRIKEKELNLNDYEFSTVLVDPPRAGLDDDTVALIQRFDRIIYISCNPETLAQNLQSLSQTHTIERSAMFDQFPYTSHIETGVFLQRK
ncbi:tRNA/tmRNA (uracil-C(5))-methyltransferase [BD1-7 clade bacterium]|uniref:tRNA/tmRNA (uracil-C(5))-methyltransferase n=1 Tax=BD1-7 clade bacterium TaxID=2029982 RepID=A0A5S9NT18_9GAMM|nr:tRNA/tmRNA (uracil-C(5))-methyltransferase [BD1-7 clade bacterium]CAA0109120.1 tRNA/tmRNA (uracil-C(5))-methyltransferase [BD1-7 clade bacterium]